jgi:hypothetical protein
MCIECAAPEPCMGFRSLSLSLPADEGGGPCLASMLDGYILSPPCLRTKSSAAGVAPLCPGPVMA